MPSLFNMMQNNQPVQPLSQNPYKQNGNYILQQLLMNPNPQKAAMSMLQQQNPQMAQFIQQAMLSGQSPQAVMGSLGISQEALTSLKSSFGR